MRLILFLVMVTIGFGGLAGGAAAQQSAGSVFEVPRVPVNAEADNASAAQQIARSMGRRRAMDILLRRLTAEEDWIYLPQLVYGQTAPVEGDPEADGETGANAPARAYDTGPLDGAGDYSSKSPIRLSPEMLPSMEEGFSVYDEKSSARTYSARITYRFKAEEVRNLLKNAQIPYSESQTRMALVIPILETNNGSYLWETNNPWARAWLARSLANELTPMLLPRGDDTDMEILPVEAALDFDQEALGQMADRYGVSQVVIAHAFLHEEDEQYRLRARLLDGYLASAQREAANYDVGNSGALYDDGAGFGEQGVLVRTSGEQPGRALIENFFRDQAGDFPALAQRAVETMVTKYSAGWKAQTLVDHSVSREISVNVWFDSLDDMRVIRRGLEASPIVENITVELSGMSGGKMTIEVVGDLDQLTADLRERNLVFWTRDGRVWNIATPSKADEVRGQGLAGNDGPLPEGVAGVGTRDDGAGEFSPPLDRERQQRNLRNGPEPQNLRGDISGGVPSNGDDID